MNNKPEEAKRVELDLRWPLEDDIPYLYANHFAVIDTGHEVILAFGNFLPTGLHKRSDQEVENFLKSSEVNPVAKIVLSPSGFEAFLGLLRNKMTELEEKKKE
jgi:hypothetical protein